MVKKMLIIFGFLLLIASPAMALTLQDLVDLGSTGIQIDDKLFYDFTYTAAGNAPEASDITVNTLNTPLNPGFQLVAGWQVGANQTADSNIQYFVKVLDGSPLLIHDASLLIAGVGIDGDGSLSVAENFFDSDNIGIGNLFVFADSGNTQLTDSLLFAEPTTGPIRGVKDILLSGGQDGLAALSLVENRVSQTGVPEPSTLLLVGAGLAGVGLFRKRSKK